MGTFVSCWINDSKEFITNNNCYNGSNISRVETTAISIDSLRRIINGIHQRNSNVWVVILGLYPDEGLKHTVDKATLGIIEQINKRVQSAFANEPRTTFAWSTFPTGVTLFQTLHPGHPNCRGGKILANAAVTALYDAKVIQVGLAPVDYSQCNWGHCSNMTLD